MNLLHARDVEIKPLNSIKPDRAMTKIKALYQQKYKKLIKHNKSRFDGVETYLQKFYIDKNK